MNGQLTLENRLYEVRTGLTTTLDLSNLGLTKIPAEVFGISRITHLIVSVVELNNPPLMRGLETAMDTHPRRGEWDAAKYNDFKKALQELRDVEASVLTTRIAELSEAIGQLHNLESLTLINQGLTHLPDALCDLPRLRELRLGMNQITALPAGFARLTTLQTLDLRNNPIADWPDGFWQMPLHQFRQLRDDAARQKNLLVKAGNFEAAVKLRAEELRWGLHQ